MANKPFVVIDAEILNSSIWFEEPHVKLVWLTLLILCDTEGQVGASVPGVARSAGVTLEQAEEALRKLQAPDPHSRTQDNEGRRLEAVDRGWRILNFKAALDRLSLERKKSRDRVRRWRMHGWKGKAAGLSYPQTGDTCPCCGRPFQTPLKQFVVLDHDHSTGAARDYICHSCNKLVADAESGRSTLEPSGHIERYLKKHDVTVTVTSVRPGNRDQRTENRDTSSLRSSVDSVGPQSNPFVKGKRVELERELMRLVALEAEKTDRDGAEVMAEVAGYKGALRTKTNPATMTDDRLMASVLDARARVKALEVKREGPRPSVLREPSRGSDGLS